MQNSMGRRGGEENTDDSLVRDLEEDAVELSTTVLEVGGVVLVVEDSAEFEDSAVSARFSSDLEGVAG